DRVTKSDISILNNYIDNVLDHDYKSSIRSVKNKFNILSEYYAELNKVATSSYFETALKKTAPSILTYEEGISRKKYYLEKMRDKFLAGDPERNKILKDWESKYPDYSREELEMELDARINKYYSEQISEIDLALSDKTNLK